MTDEFVLKCLQKAVDDYPKVMSGNCSEIVKEQYRHSYPFILERIKEYEAKVNAASK